MKLNSDNETLAENKVLILYVLSLVNKPISNDTLYSIVSAAENMNYFYFYKNNYSNYALLGNFLYSYALYLYLYCYCINSFLRY